MPARGNTGLFEEAVRGAARFTAVSQLQATVTVLTGSHPLASFPCQTSIAHHPIFRPGSHSCRRPKAVRQRQGSLRAPPQFLHRNRPSLLRVGGHRSRASPGHFCPPASRSQCRHRVTRPRDCRNDPLKWFLLPPLRRISPNVQSPETTKAARRHGTLIQR